MFLDVSSHWCFAKWSPAGVKIGKTAPFFLGLALAQLDCGAYRHARD